MTQRLLDLEDKIANCADLCYRDAKREGNFFSFNWARGRKFHMPECKAKCTAQYQGELDAARSEEYAVESATNNATVDMLLGGGNNNTIIIAAIIAAIIIIMFIL